MMKHTHALLLAGLATAASSLLAAAPDLGKLPAPAKQQGVTYDKDVKPLFEASCFRCHGADRPKNGLRLDSLEAVLKGSKDRKVILPGNSQKSPLVIAVARLDSKLEMPPTPRPPRARGAAGVSTNAPAADPAAPAGGATNQTTVGGSRPPMGPPPKPLTPEQVGLIRAWVDQGAK